MSASNVAQSIRDRLLRRARRSGENFQALLTRYALDLPAVIDDLQVFLLPPLEACARDQAFEHKWSPGGPWRST